MEEKSDDGTSQRTYRLTHSYCDRCKSLSLTEMFLGFLFVHFASGVGLRLMCSDAKPGNLAENWGSKFKKVCCRNGEHWRIRWRRKTEDWEGEGRRWGSIEKTLQNERWSATYRFSKLVKNSMKFTPYLHIPNSVRKINWKKEFFCYGSSYSWLE